MKATGKYYRYYLDEPKIPEDVWTDINSLQSQSGERLGYPTQKPEKLLAKVVLANSKPGGIVFDPFLGSGTTSVVAKKLGRKFVGIEIDEHYCCLAEKRLEMVGKDNSMSSVRYRYQTI